MNEIKTSKNNYKNINKIIVWGLKDRWHTHRFIHKAFYENAKKLGYRVIWVEDDKKNIKYIESNDLIIASEVYGKMVPQKTKLEDYNLPIRDDVFYCLHSFQNMFLEKIKPEKLLKLAVYYQNTAEKADQKWGPVTYFDTKTKTLYQPWGTDLLAEEFKKPTFNNSSFVFWIGSIWNNVLNQGNLEEIKKLKEVLKYHRLNFIHLRFIPDFLNIFFTRISRISPAIGGRFQVEENYLPCRMFKNISYGQLGITNVKKFKDIFGENFIDGNSIKEIVENALSLTKEEYLKITSLQQVVVKNYTYKQSLDNIFKALNIL